MSMNLHIGNYSLLYKLGSGSSADVYMALHDLIGKPVAIKQISKSKLTKEKDKMRLEREVSIMKTIVHQYITELYEIIEDDDHYFLVMELASGGSLKNLLDAEKTISESECRRIFREIVIGLGHCHYHYNLIHRDLKAENVLLDENRNVRLIDFGLSNVFRPGIQQTACGSPAYAAPEVIERLPYDQSADVWSLGVLLYLMTLGKFPFYDNSIPKLLKKITSEPVFIPDGTPNDLKDLLTKLLMKKPDQRIRLIDILDHPWLTKNKSVRFTDQQKLSMLKSGIHDDSMDMSIVMELHSMGIDVKKLRTCLMQKEYNEITAIYRIKRRANALKDWSIRNKTVAPYMIRRNSLPNEVGKSVSGILERAGKISVLCSHDYVRKSKLSYASGLKIPPIKTRTTGTSGQGVLSD